MELKGKRIVLRPYLKKDERRLAELANDKTVSRFTRIPCPYKLKDAKNFIKSSNYNIRKKEEYPFAITLNDEMIGGVSLIRLDKRDNRAELGYWLGKPYRRKGYAIEAAKLVLDFGFRKLKLNKILVSCAKQNNDSKRLIDKLHAKEEV
ncbi:MAG: GNAT family N-acetyltransferase [Candidatus Woesearchaeota archaeon]|nr:GNAT family N-acetyltransferase [Candidatus Woesearchaeota archaeon]